MEYHSGLILGYELVNLFINDLGEVPLESIVLSQSSWLRWSSLLEADKWMNEEQEPREIQ